MATETTDYFYQNQQDVGQTTKYLTFSGENNMFVFE